MADFAVIDSLATQNPYLSDQKLSKNFTCEETSNVAFKFTLFDTESGYDFVYLTDANNDQTFFGKFYVEI